MRRLLAATLVALALPGAALAAVEVKGVDTSAYPTVRLTAVASKSSATPPTVEENGEPVVGFSAQTLARAKSVVLLIDRSRSMNGKPLDDAVAAARAFVAAKPPEDRIAVATFATKALFLTNFSTATIDADLALRTIGVDDVEGTTLYDALVLSARSLDAEPLPARVIIAVTDGNETRSEASLDEAIAAAREAGIAVYVVAIESSRFTPEPLKELAGATGGTYYGAASSEALNDVYASIAEELGRTWQLEYVTAARPGEKLSLTVSAGGESATAAATAPGVAARPASHPKPSGVLPKPLLESSWGPFALALAVGLVILLAAAFAFASPKGSWVRSRLDPHVSRKRVDLRRSKADRERLAAATVLFRATERTFGDWRFWRRLNGMLERGDVPLRTVELLYLMGISGFAVGIVTALAGAPTLAILVALVGGALLPYMFVAFKARRRQKAFDNQLGDMLVTMAASLKAGHSFRQGIQSVVEEGQEPASKEFKRVLTETQLGRSMDVSLGEMADRVGSRDLDFVINAVTIQRQVGGSLAGLFDMVAETVRNRQQFARRIKGLTAMGRASSYVLIGLPFFMALVITVINKEYMSPLFHTSTGHKLIVVGLVMMAVGSLLLRKIVSFKG